MGGTPNEELKQAARPARGAGSDDRMAESELTDNDVKEPGTVVDENRESRVVIDFTVGPAGVGPPTSITPAQADKPLPEPPPAD